MTKIQLALSPISFIRHLKIVTGSPDMFDGYRLEELIKTQLPVLNKFEFYTRSHYDRSEEDHPESMLNAMIAPFRTPFWTTEKR